MRVTRRRNLGRLVSGLYQAQHVHLSRVADALPGRARQPSKTRRLRRLLANEAIDPKRIYRPVAQRLLRRAAESGPIGLLVDTLALTGRRRLLVAALAYRRRALPVAEELLDPLARRPCYRGNERSRAASFRTTAGRARARGGPCRAHR